MSIHLSIPRAPRPPRALASLAFAAALALAGVARADEASLPVRPSDVSLLAGLWSSSSAYHGGRSGALFAAASLEGRYVIHLFAVEAEVVGELPTASGGPGAGLSAVVRVGVSTDRFAVTAGASASFAAAPAPVQWLPSLSAAVRLGPVTPYLGVFDRFAAAPARLGLEWNDLGAGWVFPLGGEVYGRLWLARSWGLEARVMALSLFGSLTVVGMVGPVFSPGGGR